MEPFERIDLVVGRKERHARRSLGYWPSGQLFSALARVRAGARFEAPSVPGIGLVLLVAAGGASPPLLHAADDTQKPARETNAPVRVTAPPGGVGMPQDLLEGDVLRRAAAKPLGRVLESSPGLHNASFGPAVGRPVIRGQTGRRVRVLHDGLDLFDASGVSPDHALSAHPLLAEDIEILRGAAVLLYGGAALGGAVNLHHSAIPERLPEKGLAGHAETRYASVNDDKLAHFVLNAGRKTVAWHADGYFRQGGDLRIPGRAVRDPDAEFNTRGVIDNTDYEAKAGTLGVARLADWGLVGASLHRMDREYGIPPRPGGHGHEDEDGMEEEDDEEVERARIDADQRRYDFKLVLRQLPARIESVRLQAAYADYEHVESHLEAEEEDEAHEEEEGTRFAHEGWEGRLELRHGAVAGWDGIFGLQGGSSDFSARGEEAFIGKSAIDAFGLFAVERRNAGQWEWDIGARLDWQSVAPETFSSVSHTGVSVVGGARWQVLPWATLRLHLSRNQRAPAVEELFSNVTSGTTRDGLRRYNDVLHEAVGAVELGDPGFGKETAFGANLGLEAEWPLSRLMLDLFYTDFSDFIYQADAECGVDVFPDQLDVCSDPGEEADETAILLYRQRDAVFRGAEAEWTFFLPHDTELTAFTDYVRAELRGGAGPVPRIPPWRYGLEAEHRRNGWRLQARLTVAEAQNRAGRGETRTDGYVRLDAALERQWRLRRNRIVAFVQIDNLLDEEIRNAASFLRDVAPEPGRNLELGLRLAF